MVKKIYLNYPIKRVPLNGLFMLDRCFYRRGCVDRSTHEVQIVREFSLNSEISFIPSSTVVIYYKEYATE